MIQCLSWCTWRRERRYLLGGGELGDDGDTSDIDKEEVVAGANIGKEEVVPGAGDRERCLNLLHVSIYCFPSPLGNYYCP